MRSVKIKNIKIFFAESGKCMYYKYDFIGHLPENIFPVYLTKKIKIIY
jgi:hypothetical protein